IISRGPIAFNTLYNIIKAYATDGRLAVGALIVLAIVLVFVAVVVFVIYVTQAERRIPVQYAKRVVGRKMYGGQSTHIPIKVNLAGVIPVIFATSLLAFPQTLALMFRGEPSAWITKYLTPGGAVGAWVYSILNILLIIFFT